MNVLFGQFVSDPIFYGEFLDLSLKYIRILCLDESIDQFTLAYHGPLLGIGFSQGTPDLDHDVQNEGN